MDQYELIVVVLCIFEAIYIQKEIWTQMKLRKYAHTNK